jgi:hypothetical protein
MPDVSIEQNGNTVTIDAPGGEITVTVAENQTIAAALTDMGINIERLGIDIMLGEDRRDANSVTGADVEDGQTLAAPPKQAALGL